MNNQQQVNWSNAFAVTTMAAMVTMVTSMSRLFMLQTEETYMPPLSDNENELAVRGVLLTLKRASVLAGVYKSAYLHERPVDVVPTIYELHDQIEEVYAKVPIISVGFTPSAGSGKPLIDSLPIHELYDFLKPYIRMLQDAITQGDRYKILDLSSYLSEWPYVYEDTGKTVKTYFSEHNRVMYYIDEPLSSVWAPKTRKQQHLFALPLNEHPVRWYKIVGFMSSARHYTGRLGQALSILTKIMEHVGSTLPRESLFYVKPDAFETGEVDVSDIFTPETSADGIFWSLSSAFSEVHWFCGAAEEIGYRVDISFIERIFDKMRPLVDKIKTNDEDSKKALLKAVLFLLQNMEMKKT